MNRNIVFTGAMLVALLSAVPAVARVGGPPREREEAPDKVTAESGRRPERKKPSFWRRPAEDCPERQLAQARDRAGAGRYRAATRAADALVRKWHDHPQAAEAQLLLARLQEERRRPRAAFDAYQYLIAHFPGRFDYRHVIERQFAQAEMLRSRLDRRFNLSVSPDNVRELFSRVVSNAPHGPLAPEAQLAVGELYEDEGKLDEAIDAYEKLAANYPRHRLAATAAFNAVRCRHLLARKYPRDEALTAEALSAAYSLLRTAPGHPEAGAVRKFADDLHDRLAGRHYEQAVYYDRIRRDPRAAGIAYSEFLRRFPQSPQAGKAAVRLEELEAKGHGFEPFEEDMGNGESGQ